MKKILLASFASVSLFVGATSFAPMAQAQATTGCAITTAQAGAFTDLIRSAPTVDQQIFVNFMTSFSSGCITTAQAGAFTGLIRSAPSIDKQIFVKFLTDFTSGTSTTTQDYNAALEIARLKGADASIKANLSNARALAEIYYDNSNNSYAGVCNTSSSKIPETRNLIMEVGSGTACNDSATAWAMSAQLRTNTSQNFCVDSTGVASVTSSQLGSSTSCSRTTTSAPTITVIYPNGGEQLMFGVKDVDFRTEWKSANVTGNVTAYLHFPDGGTCKIGTVPVSQGYLTARIGTNYQCPGLSRTVTAGIYSVLLAADNGNPNDDRGIRDESDKHFTVTLANQNTIAPTIIVTFPNSGDRITKGSTYRITWDSQNVSSLYIKLRKGNDTYRGIPEEGAVSGVIANQGFYNWTVPTSLPDGSDYAIRVISSDGSYISDGSMFTVSSGQTIPAPMITVTSPNGSEPWQVGGKYIVSWQPIQTGDVSIYLTKPDNAGCWLATVPSANGFATIQVSLQNCQNANWNVISPGQYRLGMTYSVNSIWKSTSYSNYFTVSSGQTAAAPTITSITPSQGDANTSVTIYGTNLSGASSVEFYSSGGQFVSSLVLSSVSATNVVFTINSIFAANAAPGTYQLSVVTNACAGGCNSNRVNFTLNAPATTAPTITVTTNPTSVAWGNASTISWNSTNATSCKPSSSTGDPGFALAGIGTTGSASSYPIYGPTTFTVSCTGAGGTSAQSTTVNVK